MVGKDVKRLQELVDKLDKVVKEEQKDKEKNKKDETLTNNVNEVI